MKRIPNLRRLIGSSRRLADHARLVGGLLSAAPLVMEYRRASQLYKDGQYDAAMQSAARAVEKGERWQARIVAILGGDEDDPEVQKVLADNGLIARNAELLGTLHLQMG